MIGGEPEVSVTVQEKPKKTPWLPASARDEIIVFLMAMCLVCATYLAGEKTAAVRMADTLMGAFIMYIKGQRAG